MQRTPPSVLPIGGATDVNESYRGSKVVDHANPNSKFSRRGICLSNRSTVFSTDPLPVAAAVPANKTDPFHRDPEGKVTAERCSLRITGMTTYQESRTVNNESKPRSRGAGMPPERDQGKDGALFTAFGTSYGGKSVGVQTNRETMPDHQRALNSTESARFRLTPRPCTNVLIPQSMKDSTPPAKIQRFSASQRHAQQSLVGVLGTMPHNSSVNSHKVSPPWSTDN